MLRTGTGPLRPVWRFAYLAVARVVSAYLRAGHRGASVYAIGSLGGPDTVYGISDIDLAVVVPSLAGRRGEARDAIRHRWERLCRVAPPLRELLFVAVYEEPELERAAAGSPCLRSGPPAGRARARGALFRPGPFVDPADVAFRPGLKPPLSGWGLLAGLDGLPRTREPEADQRAVVAWLELQHWWRYAIRACVTPGGPRTAYLCVKLASEPARIWLWLAHGEHVSSRREALERGAQELPEAQDTFDRALKLQGSLHRSPTPPLAEMLEGLVLLTARIAGWLAAEVEPAGAEEVRLVWDEGDQLVLAPRAGDPLRAALGLPPQLRPLVDWRTLVWGGAPDEAFARFPGSPPEPATLATAAVASRRGPYPAVSGSGLLVLPTHVYRRGLLRAVQCPVTDPVSFALLDGAAAASFSRVGPWSIREAARRAVAEHAAWLAAGGATGDPSADALGLLFNAGRAGLLVETLEAGEPELTLTVAAVVRGLSTSGQLARPVAEAAFDAYVACRTRGGLPHAGTVAELRRGVLALPAYRQPAAPLPSAA